MQEIKHMERLKVFTNAANIFSDKKRMVYFRVPLEWLKEYLKDNALDGYRLTTEYGEADREQLLIDAIYDGVVEWGW